jgi:hypothetical protein
MEGMGRMGRDKDIRGTEWQRWGGMAHCGLWTDWARWHHVKRLLCPPNKGAEKGGEGHRGHKDRGGGGLRMAHIRRDKREDDKHRGEQTEGGL